MLIIVITETIIVYIFAVAVPELHTTDEESQNQNDSRCDKQREETTCHIEMVSDKTFEKTHDQQSHPNYPPTYVKDDIDVKLLHLQKKMTGELFDEPRETYTFSKCCGMSSWKRARCSNLTCL
jgi:hypothetical protein